jgi:hypothetical protein
MQGTWAFILKRVTFCFPGPVMGICQSCLTIVARSLRSSLAPDFDCQAMKYQVYGSFFHCFHDWDFLNPKEEEKSIRSLLPSELTIL